MPELPEIAEFSQVCAERFAEAEMFLSADKDFTGSQQLESAARRVEYIRLKAEALGLADFAGICGGLVGALRGSGRLDSPAALALREVFDCLRFYMTCEKMRADGHKAPENYARFAAEASGQLISRAKGQARENEGLRILLADDEEVVRSFLEELLLDDGNIVLSVKNGDEAIAALDTGFFELMYTDINMPFASGLDVLRHAAAARLDTAIVIITGYASIENAAEAIRFGAYDYITKPFRDSESLLSIVERAREHITLRRQNRQLMRDMQNKNRELKRYAEGLEEALKNLEEKNRALIHADRMATLGVLVAGLAHEINNPTTFIRGNLQTLEKFWKIAETPLREAASGNGKSDKLEFVLRETPVLLQDMIVGTDRITRITSGLRSFARADNVDDLTVVSPEVCINHALNLTNNRLRKGVELVKNIEVLDEIQCSEQQITQVLVNLIVNAADAVEGRDAPKICIEAQSAGSGVLIRVGDNGAGVPEAIRKKIFDPFFTTKPVDRGTGLGLSISQGIVHNHGGTLSVSCPTSGEWGTVFELLLPKYVPPMKPADVPRIMLANAQDSAFHALASGIRTSSNYEMEVVSSGEELFDRLDSFAPDLLLIDTGLPDMDGFEILERLKGLSAHRAVRVLVMTDFSGPDVRQRMLELGADKVFIKPCKMNDITDSITALLVSREAGDGAKTRGTK